LKHLLDPIVSLNTDVDLLINNESIWFYPHISVIIADWPEASTFCLTYKSSNSNLPCHFCLITKNNLVNINLLSSNIELKFHENMYNHFEKNTKKSVSIESVYNFF